MPSRTDSARHGADGLLLVDKMSGPTSHDVVAKVRRTLGQRRVGHAGTLDPMAEGLLPLVLGRATRLVRFLPASPKLYDGTLRLGLRTDTDDVTGAVLARHEGQLPAAEEVLTTAAAMEGLSLQVPPAYSARKVDGQRLYRLARAGATVEAPPAEVEVKRFELTPVEATGVFAFLAEVSGGTYIRALARDLGHRLGCGACLASLRRTRIGPLQLDQALRLSDDGTDERDGLIQRVIPPDRMPLEPPTVRLEDPELVERFAHGAPVRAEHEADSHGMVCVVGPTGAMVGLGEASQGLIRPRIIL